MTCHGGGEERHKKWEQAIGLWQEQSAAWSSRRIVQPITREEVMADREPLTFKTSVLIESLNEELDKRATARSEQKQKTKERNEKAIDQLNQLMEDNPTFLRDMVSRVEAFFGNEHHVGTEEFAVHVRHYYGSAPYDDQGEPEYDVELKRLVRVYEKADDESVKVHVTDEVYPYL